MKQFRISNTYSAALILGAALLHPISKSHAQGATNRVLIPPVQLTPVTLNASVPLYGCQEPWMAARDRWWDVAGNPYTAFLNGTQRFSYGSKDDKNRNAVGVNIPQVKLSYSTAPPVPYFIGHMDAKGLKPNFSYQLKLVGKPTKGTRGWGAEADELANERIGYAGRWFCGHPIHSSGTNFDDNHYIEYYKNAVPGAEHNIHGYIFIGEFITDGLGNAQVDFFADNAYHIGWQWWQNAAKDVYAYKAKVQGAMLPDGSGYYGYGASLSPNAITMYYENEPGRTSPITLPPGTYNCRFVLTEESFHSPAAAIPEGGYWKTVMATEDIAYEKFGNELRAIGHDTDPANDVIFTIGSSPALTDMKAVISMEVNRKSRSELEATTYVTVTDNIGRRIRGVNVTGKWSGVFDNEKKDVTVSTAGAGAKIDGVARITTPTVKVRRGGCFKFTITNIEKKGRTWNGSNKPSVQACL